MEYTAETITAYFNLDLDLLRSYGLAPEALELPMILALYKIRAFLDGSMRLRSRCHFSLVKGLKVTEPQGYEVPAKEPLFRDLRDSIGKCKKFFANPPTTEIRSKVVIKEEKKNTEAADQEQVTDGSATEDGEEKKSKPTAGKKDVNDYNRITVPSRALSRHHLG